MDELNTISLADLSDPEKSATHGIINDENDDYLDNLKNQIKLNLLCSEKIYMPLGFLVDNPAIWELLINEVGFKDVLA
jgi:hypothetical protein